jgi:hypothetical protein
MKAVILSSFLPQNYASIDEKIIVVTTVAAVQGSYPNESHHFVVLRIAKLRQTDFYTCIKTMYVKSWQLFSRLTNYSLHSVEGCSQLSAELEVVISVRKIIIDAYEHLICRELVNLEASVGAST